jgi:hypothetical protein
MWWLGVNQVRSVSCVKTPEEAVTKLHGAVLALPIHVWEVMVLNFILEFGCTYFRFRVFS